MKGQRNDGAAGPRLSKATFADYLRTRWLPTYRAQSRSTYNIEKIVGKWILFTATTKPDVPFLGNKKLSKLTVADFDRLYAAMVEKHGMRRGVTYLHGIVKRALQFAVDKGELTHNPAKLATVPEEDEGDVESFTKEQEERFLEAATRDRWAALWFLLRDAGLRPGEAFALKWDHIDLQGTLDADVERVHLVKVRHTLKRVGVRKPRDGGVRSWELALPKTKNSKRDVPISQTTVAALMQLRERQAEERKLVGDLWQEHGFVFSTERGTPLGNNLGRLWSRVLREADRGDEIFGTLGPEPAKRRSGPTPERPFTPHFSMYVLRHTMITRNYLDGMDLALLSRRAGHANVAFTFDRYGRGVKAEHTKAAAAGFDRRMADVKRLAPVS